MLSPTRRPTRNTAATDSPSTQPHASHPAALRHPPAGYSLDYGLQRCSLFSGVTRGLLQRCSGPVVTLLIAFAGAHVPYRTASLRLRGPLVNVPAAMQCVCKCSTRARCLLQRCSGHTCSSPRPRACELADVLPLALEHQPYPTLASSAAMQTHQRVGCDQLPPPRPTPLPTPAPAPGSFTDFPHKPPRSSRTHSYAPEEAPPSAPQAPTSPPRTLPAQAQDTPQHPNTPLLHASRTSPYQLACTSQQLDQQDSPNSASTPRSSTSSRFPTFVLSVFRAPQAMKSWMSNKLKLKLKLKQWGPTVTRARTHYLLTSQSLLLGVNSPVVALRRNGCGVTSGKPEIVACPFCTFVPFPYVRNHFSFVCLLGITAPLFLSWNKSSYAWIN